MTTSTGKTPVLQCTQCGYLLAGSPYGVCPECGASGSSTGGRRWRTLAGRYKRTLVWVVALLAVSGAVGTGRTLQHRAAQDRCLADLIAAGVTVHRRAATAGGWTSVVAWICLPRRDAVEGLFFPTNGATDEHVRNATLLRDVRHLYVDGTAVTNASLQHVRAFPRLSTLWLSGTGVTVGAVEALRRDRPTLTVHGP